MEQTVVFHSQGQILRGNLRIPFEGAPCVLLSHGLEGSKDSIKWKFLANRLNDLGLACLRFNYRGCGEGTEKSDGLFDDSLVSKRILDFTAALDFIQQSLVDPDRLGVIGSSLGGTVAINAGDKRIKALVTLAAPFAFQKPDSREISCIKQQEYASLPSGKTVKSLFFKELWGLDTGQAVAALECPFMILHGSRDPVVPSEDAEKLFVRAREPRMLKIIEEANMMMII